MTGPIDLWAGALLDCAVWHARSGDVSRDFRYRVRYVALPVDDLEAGALPIRPDRPGLWQIRRRDYGIRDGTSLVEFITSQLAPIGLAGCDVALVTLPRSPGFGFNPVSFWMVRDESGLRAVLAEVSNTFSERHHYLVRHDDNRVIAPTDRFGGEKLFHVSPFLPREGKYVFRFDSAPGRFGAWIDWIGEDGVTLKTAMTGPLAPLTNAGLRRAALRAPLQAMRVIALIHWQALKLKLRGVRYRTKPEQHQPTHSAATQPERRR